MGFAVNDSRLVSRNVLGTLGRTSIRLEPELWDALGEICRRERMSIAETIRAIETRMAGIDHPGGRTSAVRVHIVGYFRAAATEEGHLALGHGGSD
jgi:predicted DNA-binding ribbon-helix-helix protein